MIVDLHKPAKFDVFCKLFRAERDMHQSIAIRLKYGLMSTQDAANTIGEFEAEARELYHNWGKK